MDIQTAPAENLVLQLLTYSLLIICQRPIDTVKYSALVLQITLAAIKSTQGDIKAVSTVNTITGFERGIVILVNTSHLVAQSIIAASSRALGTVSKKPFAIYKPSPEPAEYTRTRATLIIGPSERPSDFTI